MEVREGSMVGALVKTIGVEDQKWLEHSKAVAEQFPATIEEYMDLPENERMRLATDMVRTYFPFASYEKFDIHSSYPFKKKSVHVKVATDKPGIIINGAVAGDPGSTTDALNMTFVNRSPGLIIWAQAEDITDGAKSFFVQLGRVQAGGDEIRARENSYGKGDYFDADDPRTQEMIEIIDAAASSLIAGIVNERRNQIGRRAVRSTIEA